MDPDVDPAVDPDKDPDMERGRCGLLVEARNAPWS
ncbi:hypothetical protein FB570_104376 [Streptomyces sp. T12]|nr:hypothetical protein FB570_104376 [Streptomyces sp. T12]